MPLRATLISIDKCEGGSKFYGAHARSVDAAPTILVAAVNDAASRDMPSKRSFPAAWAAGYGGFTSRWRHRRHAVDRSGLARLLVASKTLLAYHRGEVLERLIIFSVDSATSRRGDALAIADVAMLPAGARLFPADIAAIDDDAVVDSH